MKEVGENDFFISDDDIINSMMESSFEDAMIEAAMESSYEDAMIDAAIESSYEDAMMDAAIESSYEDSMIEDAMMDNMISYGSSKDSTDNVYYLIDKELNSRAVKSINTNFEDDVRFVLFKKFEKLSASGKTAYFSYIISDIIKKEKGIEIFGLTCNGAEIEHWVSWKYDDTHAVVSHFFKTDENLSSIVYYPFIYNYADILQLNKYNPYNFHFQKLDFLKNDNTTSCGDKFSVCKISSANKSFQNFYIKDFAINIIPIMKGISNYSSINEYIVVENLKLAINYINMIKRDQLINAYSIQSVKSIINYTDCIIIERMKYIKNEITQNLNSELCTLVSEYNKLKE